MSRLRMIFALISVVLIVSLLGLPDSRSAPKGGGGGGPVPPGKILYTYNGQAWQMNGDGSGKSTVSIAGSAVPSRDTYSGHRWSVRMSNGEVWATPNNVDYLQITNLQQHDNGDGTITCTILNDGTGARLSWSNGGDSFISVKGIHWVQDASLPVPAPEADWSDVYLAIYRLDVSALELETRYQLGLPGPALDITQAVPVITEPFGYEENFTEHQWSPDGTRIAYKWRNNFEDFGPADLWVADVGPGVTLPVDALTDGVRIVNIGLNRIDFPQWSPPNAAEQRIAFRYSNGDLRTVRPDGTGLTTVGSVSYGPCFWSPDGNHFVYRQLVQKTPTRREYYLYRVPSSGGTSVLLTGDLNKELDKGLLGWGN